MPTQALSHQNVFISSIKDPIAVIQIELGPEDFRGLSRGLFFEGSVGKQNGYDILGYIRISCEGIRKT